MSPKVEPAHALTNSDIRRQSVVKKTLIASMASVFGEWVLIARRAHAQGEGLLFWSALDEQVLGALHELDADTVDQCCQQQATILINQLMLSGTRILTRLVDTAEDLLANRQELTRLLRSPNRESSSFKQEAIAALARGYAELLTLAVRSQRDVNASLGLLMPLSRKQQTILLKLNYEVVWAASHNVANSVFDVSDEHKLAHQMPALFARLAGAIEDNRLLNHFIKNGASNAQICDLFGLHAQETGWRRRGLGVAAPSGRIMRYDHPYRVLKVWQELSESYPDERYRYLAILEHINDITLGQVHKILMQAAGLLAANKSVKTHSRIA